MVLKATPVPHPASGELTKTPTQTVIFGCGALECRNRRDKLLAIAGDVNERCGGSIEVVEAYVQATQGDTDRDLKYEARSARIRFSSTPTKCKGVAEQRRLGVCYPPGNKQSTAKPGPQGDCYCGEPGKCDGSALDKVTQTCTRACTGGNQCIEQTFDRECDSILRGQGGRRESSSHVPPVPWN